MRFDNSMVGTGRVQNGFTLIEIIIVVAIIGIISVIAIPSYQDYVEETRRSAAQADLIQASQWMERRYSETFDYSDGGSAPTLPAKFKFSPQDSGSSNAFYKISLEGVTADGFTLKAEPINGQTGDVCGTLTLNEKGAKSPTTSGCW